MRKRGSILVGLLWCVVLLSLVVIGVLHMARMDLMTTKNFGDKIQAHYLALAGIEKAKALLYHEAHQRTRSERNHSGELYDSPDQFRDITLGRGIFRVFRRARPDEGGGVIFGVADEESRLNINTATAAEFTQLEGFTTNLAVAVIAWRGGGDVRAQTSGAVDADYYASLRPPYQPRNGPFQTVREMLMVRGMPPDLLLGNDLYQNGLLDDMDESESGSVSGSQSGPVDSGWAGIMTVDSVDNNVSAAGQSRVDVQTADEPALTGVRGITPQIANAIIQYRGQHQFHSVADLLDVTPPQNQNRRGGPNQRNQPVQPASNPSGPKVIDEDLLMDIADDLTASSDQEETGLVNINTAGLEVLACLPGLTRELAQAIISYRQSAGFFPNIAWLLKVQGINRQIFKQVGPMVTARSETFRILSEGKVKSTGARQRIQVIVHVGLDDIQTLSYREKDL
jgi:competence ComEA-like helix-hairpin-helix protein